MSSRSATPHANEGSGMVVTANGRVAAKVWQSRERSAFAMRAAFLSPLASCSPRVMEGVVSVVALTSLSALGDGASGIIEARSSSSSSKGVLAPQDIGFEVRYTASLNASSMVRVGDRSRADEMLLGLALAWVTVEKPWL